MSVRALRTLAATVAFVLVSLFAHPACAHKPSDSYLALTVTGARIDGRWDVALRDLDNVLALDRDGNGTVTWVNFSSDDALKLNVANTYAGKTVIGPSGEILASGGNFASTIARWDGTQWGSLGGAGRAFALAALPHSEAIAGGNINALNYFVANKYVEALKEMANSPNQKMLLLPMEATGILGSSSIIGPSITAYNPSPHSHP